MNAATRHSAATLAHAAVPRPVPATEPAACVLPGYLAEAAASGRAARIGAARLVQEARVVARAARDEAGLALLDAAPALRGGGAMAEALARGLDHRVAGTDPRCARSDAARRLGRCAALAAAPVGADAARALARALHSPHDLTADPRIAALRLAVSDALAEGIAPLEGHRIARLVAALLVDRFGETGIAGAAFAPVVEDRAPPRSLRGLRVALSGTFACGPRRLMVERLARAGARVARGVEDGIAAVVIGDEGTPFWCHARHGGKVADALDARRRTGAPLVLREVQLRALLR
ncbi:hypothetical protein [Jannaschia sp. W003]|uniref:hypothetical protein n=1 Tax=Jannaschia sp. W003 TaxID=2867012 RepID=UPI0021A3931B|nr:hypothetical protein [Jannaschia sp. W003]UWQ21062.1 hypothetical protein K3554_13960 [Jannaschia sp. W003]